jgi:hypothetical protein
MKLKHYTSTLILSALLCGCLIPEKFTATLVVKPDASYTYKYEGTAMHFLAAAAIKEKGSLAAKDEEALKKDAEKSSKGAGVEKLNYLGQGRYEVSLKQDLKAGQQPQTLKVFSFTKDQDGIFTIGQPAMTTKDMTQLKSMGIKINGKAEVTLPGNAEIVSHNAKSTPGLFSKSYVWDISAPDHPASLRFKLK